MSKHHTSRRVIFVAAVALLLICVTFAATYAYFHSINPALQGTFTTSETIYIDRTPLRVAISNEEGERVRGLSGVRHIDINEGMLFMFPVDGTYGIWMKDMLFPIDVMWVSSDGVVVHIERHILPESFPQVYTNKVPARYVIETVGDFAELHNIEIGSLVTF